MKDETIEKISHWLWTTDNESRLTSFLMFPLRLSAWIYNMLTTKEQP